MADNGLLTFANTVLGSSTAVEAGAILNAAMSRLATAISSVTSAGVITLTKGLLSISPTAGIGYATGAGGVVTQATDKSTGVTLNTVCGTITMNGAQLAAAAEIAFTVTNSTVAATDVVAVSIKSGGTTGSYFATVSAVAAGSFDITIGNASAGNLSEAVVINFVVLKGVAA